MTQGTPSSQKLDPATRTPLVLRLKALDGALTRSEAVVAQWLVNNQASLGLETGASVAAKTGVSEITVSRFLRRLGYRGLSALKRELQTSGAAQLAGSELYLRLLDGELGALLRRDAEAVLAIATQIARPEWAEAIIEIEAANEVFVTGFQTVKGVAEDFARRLAIVRSGVRILVAHDAGLAEWIEGGPRRSCLILVDTVPYDRGAEPIVRLAARSMKTVVVVTDDLNTWAVRHTPFVFFVTSKVGAFVESTGPLASMLNLVTHAVAAQSPERSAARLAAWPSLLRDLGLFR